MALVVVPVRYPLCRHSKATLAKALDIAEERDAELTVLHVDRYQDGRNVTRAELKRTVEREFGRLDRGRFVIRRGFLVEETILDESPQRRPTPSSSGRNRPPGGGGRSAASSTTPTSSRTCARS